MAEDGKIKIDKFDGHDFRFWKMQIKDYLYQKKLYEPLAEAKPTGMKAEDWTLLDRQALGVVRLSMAKNVAYNVVNEKTTYILFKALSNMYEKPNHVNEFNSILSRLMSVDIKFDDEVQALLLLSSLPESWSDTFTAVSGSTRTTKLKFDNIRDLILREDIHRKTSREYSNSLLSAYDKGMGRKQDRGQKQNIEDLERFKLRFGKVRLAHDKTLDIEGVRDVVLKTSFGTSWTLKDVRYIPGLRKRLISVGQLDEEGNHVPSDGINATIDGRGNATPWHQRLGHMSKKGMKILASKEIRVYFLKKKSKVFNTFKKWKAAVENETNLRVKFLKSDNGGEYSSREFIEYCAENGIRMLKTVPETPQQNEEWQGKEVSLAYLRVFGCESYIKVKYVARDKLDAKSVKCTFIGYGSNEIGYRFWDSKGQKVIQSEDVTFNEDSLYGAKAATNSSNLMKPNQKDQVSRGGSLDTSEGSENSGSFEDSERSYEDKASFEEEGSETPHVRRSTRESRLQGFLVSWERRKPHVQVEEKFVRIKASTETMMKDLGSEKQILGMSIIRDKTKGTLRLSQEKYIGNVLEKFKMKDAEARRYPLGDHFKLIGSVMYATVCTRPDIAHAVGVVSRFMSNPVREHWEAVKWLLCYLKGISQATICLSRKEVVLEGFSDSDYGGCLVSGKNNTGYVFTVGEAGKELVWLKNFLEQLDRAQTNCALFCDNQSAIHLAKNPVFHG
nr:retrovirus-related Pol polyprotein from transposon TNT 1-94 [Tanacetum cinerariifolium]